MTAVAEPDVFDIQVRKNGDHVEAIPTNPRSYQQKLTSLACKIAALRIESFLTDFSALLDYVAMFAIRHSSSLADVFISSADHQIVCVLVRSNQNYDDGLAREMGDLDICVREKFPSISFDSIDLPPKSDPDAFLNHMFVLKFVGWREQKS